MENQTNSRIGLDATVFIFSILFFFMISGKTSGQNNWVHIGSNSEAQGQPEISDLKSCSDSVTFLVKFFGFYVDSIVLNDTLYQNVRLPGEYSTLEPGMPALPLIRKLVAIPECSGIDVLLAFDSSFVLNNYTVMPAPGYIDTVVEGNPTIQPVFQKDQNVYQTNQWYPANQFVVNSTGYLRGQKLAEIFFYPFQFNPVLKQLRVCKGINVKVIIENPQGKINSELGIFRNVARHSTINYQLDELGPASQTSGAGQGSVNWYTLTSPADVDLIQADYLMITAGRFFSQNNLQSETYRIAKHRADYNGYDVAILNVENIVSDAVGFDYSGSTAQGYTPETFKTERRIRSCIKRLYENNLAQHTADGKLAYVLLVGDAKESSLPDYLYNGVPPAHENLFFYPPSYYDTPSDYYYVCITSNSANQYDCFGDLLIGRFPADSPTELHNIVNKTIRYETEACLAIPNKGLYHTGGLSSTSTQSQLIYMEDPLGFNNEFIPRIVTSPNEYSIRDENNPSTMSSYYDIFNDLNNGVNIYSYYDHSTEYYLGWGLPGSTILDTNYYKANLQNTIRNPLFFAFSCHNGTYNDNSFNADCFSEVMMTYSPDKGFVGSFASYNLVSLETSPLPIVPCVFYELFHNNLWTQLSQITGELVMLTKNQYLSFFPYFNEYHFNFSFNLFCDPALSLFPKGYQVSQDLTLSGDIYISTPVTVKSGYTLTVTSGTRIHLIDKGSLTIEEDAAIVFNNTSTLTGINDNNYLLVKGSINKLNNLTFTALNGNHWNGLYIDNTSLALTVNATASFMHCGLRGRWQSLTVNGTSFTDSWLSVVESNADIQNCTFNQSYVAADNEGGCKSAGLQIKNCTFSGTPDPWEAIRAEGYPIFNIENNNITYSGSDGIALYNCGSLNSRAHYIKSNEITYDGTTGGFNNGIKLYNGLCELSGNYIHHNPVGISLLNLTSGTLTGNSTASNSPQTQRITNNSVYQLYLSQVSSAPEVKWNAIFQEVNSPNYPYIKYDQATGYSNPIINVSYNYWGSNFLPQSDLNPFNKFVYTPIWQLSYKSVPADSISQGLFESATAMEADSNYLQAESAYKMVIEQYPESACATASMNHLFWLSDHVFGTQQAYKQYFLSDTTIVSHPHLKKVGQWLANHCDIALGNYEQAEFWLDSIVQNPASASDSLYALIDLARVQTRFDTSVMKQAVYPRSTGSMPKDLAGFLEKRREWIDRLYTEAQKTEAEHTVQDTFGISTDREIYNIYPNPAIDKLFIEINITGDDYITVELYGLSGVKYTVFRQKPVKKGTQVLSIDTRELKASIGKGLAIIKIWLNSHCYTQKIFIN